MQNIEFPYGKSFINVEIAGNLLQVIKPNKFKGQLNDVEEIESAINNPSGTTKLEQILKEESKVAIIVSDITRPSPVKKILPLVLKKLLQTGINKENINIIFALGNHRKQTKEEQKAVLGADIYNNFIFKDFDNKDTVYVGTTSYGTPVWVSRIVYEADLRICIGNIEFHYFAGFTGGLKAILPGVCGKETITHNHSLMKLPGAAMGVLEKNPVRQDLEEAGKMLGHNFIINVVLDEHKYIIKAVAGDPIIAHREGCTIAEKIYQVNVPELADVVIASAGGFPKDMNLYQAQKALENARKVIKPQGGIVLLAKCPDGPGEGTFKEWMTGSNSIEEVIKKFEKDFILGGHKAGVIAKILAKNPVYLISDLDKDTTKKYFFSYAPSVDWAIEVITERIGCQPKIIAMPYAHLTKPMVKSLVSVG